MQGICFTMWTIAGGRSYDHYRRQSASRICYSHTVGPIWNGGKNNEDVLLSNAYLNSLKLASEKNLKTIAFPNISTGVYHFPKERAASIAIETTQKFLLSNPVIEKVIFVCFDSANYNIYKAKLRS